MPRNTHWKVEAADEASAIAAATAAAIADGLIVLRAARARQIDAEPGWWYVTLSTERP